MAVIHPNDPLAAQELDAIASIGAPPSSTGGQTAEEGGLERASPMRTLPLQPGQAGVSDPVSSPPQPGAGRPHTNALGLETSQAVRI